MVEMQSQSVERKQTTRYSILSERDPEVVGSQLPLATPSGHFFPSREGNPATPGLFSLLLGERGA
jgi:hypothetical protein